MANITETDFTEKLLKLKSLVFQFDPFDKLSAGQNFEKEKTQLLNELVGFSSFKQQSFQQFHQLLMAMMAYPSSKVLLDTVTSTMQKLLLQLEGNVRLQNKLIGTGILHTSVECNFSYAKIMYVTQKFPNQISIHSSSSNLETQKSILKLLLPLVEYSNIFAGDKEFKQRISKFHSSKTQTDLEWLLQLIQQSNLDTKIQAIIYNQLEIFIQWKVSVIQSSVSFLKGALLPTYYHTKPIDKKINLQDIIQQKLPAPEKLTDKDKANIIDAAKMTLFYLYRETEPFTNANKDDIKCFTMP